MVYVYVIVDQQPQRRVAQYYQIIRYTSSDMCAAVQDSLHILISTHLSRMTKVWAENSEEVSGWSYNVRTHDRYNIPTLFLWCNSCTITNFLHLTAYGAINCTIRVRFLCDSRRNSNNPIWESQVNEAWHHYQWKYKNDQYHFFCGATIAPQKMYYSSMDKELPNCHFWERTKYLN